MNPSFLKGLFLEHSLIGQHCIVLHSTYKSSPKSTNGRTQALKPFFNGWVIGWLAISIFLKVFFLELSLIRKHSVVWFHIGPLRFPVKHNWKNTTLLEQMGFQEFFGLLRFPPAGQTKEDDCFSISPL